MSTACSRIGVVKLSAPIFVKSDFIFLRWFWITERRRRGRKTYTHTYNTKLSRNSISHDENNTQPFPIPLNVSASYTVVQHHVVLPHTYTSIRTYWVPSWLLQHVVVPYKTFSAYLTQKRKKKVWPRVGRWTFFLSRRAYMLYKKKN